MPSDIKEAQRMMDLFTSVGARNFVVTKLDAQQRIIWGKPYSTTELRDKLRAMVQTAEGKNGQPGENLIVRPSGAEVTFVQLDDLSADQLDRVRPAAFMIISTSPGNFQAWIAAEGVAKHESKEFIRRVRKAVDGADKSASGATRVSGSFNYKEKYAPEYPMIKTVQGIPGRVMTTDRLQSMGLLAAVELPPKFTPPRVSPGRASERWPSYAIELSRAPLKKDGSPNRSTADINWCMVAISWNHSVEDVAARLLNVSEKAYEQAYIKKDENYPILTARKAERYVEENRQKGRSRA
jgi:hypothetical protein